MAYFHYFPEAFIQMNLEIQNHPDLLARMGKHVDTDPELQFAKMIAEAAAYVNVVLDDTYDEALFIKIADEVTTRLKKRRESIVITSGTRHVDAAIKADVDKAVNYDWVKHFMTKG